MFVIPLMSDIVTPKDERMNGEVAVKDIELAASIVVTDPISVYQVENLKPVTGEMLNGLFRPVILITMGVFDSGRPLFVVKETVKTFRLLRVSSCIIEADENEMG